MPRIKIDAGKCTGCRYCEAVCALEHFSVMNPMKSRIRVIANSEQRLFVPLIAGPFTDTQCTNKTVKDIGRVEIDGESWLADSREPLAAGQKIRVDGINKLVLTVKPADNTSGEE